MAVTLPRYATALLPDDPSQLGPYLLLGRLGGWETRPVFLARAATEPWVALHTLAVTDVARPERCDAFLSNARSARGLDSPRITRVLDVGVDGDRPYLAADFADGPTLREEVAAWGPLSGPELRRLAVAFAEAVAALAGAGVVHGRLAPSDIVLSDTGPRLVDLGLSSGLGDEPPPALAATSAADVFAWGAIVAYAATGRTITPSAPDWRGEPVWPVSPPGPSHRATRALGEVVAAALAPDPADCPSPGELLTRLAGIDQPAARPRGRRPGWPRIVGASAKAPVTGPDDPRPYPAAAAAADVPPPRYPPTVPLEVPEVPRQSAAPGDGPRHPPGAIVPTRIPRSRVATGTFLSLALVVVALLSVVAARAVLVPTRAGITGLSARATGLLAPTPAVSTAAASTPTIVPTTPEAMLATAPARVAVVDLRVNGVAVASTQRIVVHGPRAAQSLRGRITGAVPAGHRLFVVSTPGPPTGRANFVQGELTPAADGSLALTVQIAGDGTYYGGLPDRLTILLADANASQLLRRYEAPPSKRKAIVTLPAVTPLAFVDIVKVPA